eukprot:c9866_g1_i1 orf=530-2599(+)
MVMSPAAMLAIKHKTPLKARTLSPSQNILSPNNDDYERAQVRAARAAAQRRKSFVGLEAEKLRQNSFGEEDLLGKDQILDLFQNCIKLSTENKINQRNTWELRLIDHISEIVNADDGDDVETNFQKASCTLEAGVKIYSYRVDSVHSETFKVLGGLNRTAADEADFVDADSPMNAEGSEEENGNKKKDSQKKMTTSSATLESYDALNVKKFDVAFTVDPLFNQMSAQFDEGGAKGLLLNSLSVYSGCKLVFDSSDIPSRYVKSNTGSNGSTTIDLSSMKDSLHKLKMDIKAETEISPTLRELLKLLDDPCRRAAELEGAKQSAENAEDCVDTASNVSEEDEMGEVFDNDLDDNVLGQSDESHANERVEGMGQENEAWDFDCDRQEDGDDQDTPGGMGHTHANENEARQLIDWINTGLDLRSNAWAGPDHWKFKKSQDTRKDPEPTGKTADKKKLKNEKFSIDFSCPPHVDMSSFAPAADFKSLMMPQSNASVSTLLPEDCHYQPEDLVRLFLQPSVMLLNHKGKIKSATITPSSNPFEATGMQWDNSESGGADDWDDENTHGDIQYSEEGDMIPQPRKVQKIEVDYDKTSKQIDVRVLKETLWQNLQDVSSADQEESKELSISFKSVLSQVPTACGAATAPGDISVHLCFICLLHLANEHNLRILDCASLDELYIENVVNDFCASEVIN